MNKPKMILFDYGHTLVHETSINHERGVQAILAHATSNKNNISAQQASKMAVELFTEHGKARSEMLEIHNFALHRYLYEYLQIEIDLTPEEMEDVFWDAFAPGVAMPGTAQMLTDLKAMGIRTGVISNISYSGGSLARRIHRLLPQNSFEFIIASSEYGFRKPSPRLFEVALRKADLPAEEVWYCGDNPKMDIEGAAGAGLYPVWYQSHLERLYGDDTDAEVCCKHAVVTEWEQLTALINSL